ncbi:mucin-5B-like [Engystomops pustulosus]|uniref:mucin-5B-like n=1 Tax=Engystomops pustulosus TaxID=76066 RepID=UPI003AFAB280
MVRRSGRRNVQFVKPMLTESRTHLILGELVPCSSSERETCLKSVTLSTDNWSHVVKVIADGTVLLNGLKVTLPHVSANFSILEPCKNYAIVQTTHGLQLEVQLKPKMQLYIRTENKASRKHLQGLCGNFNYKEGDDFLTSGGLVEATASAFANTWKTLAICHDSSDWLDDPCSASIENKNYADYWCSELEDEKSPFAKCHSTLDPTEYIKAGKKYTKVFPSFDPLAQEMCLEEMSMLTLSVQAACSGGKVYFDCNKSKNSLSRALLRRSCKTLGVEHYQTECISGCVCPNLLLDDGAGGCVPEDRCPCVHNENIYQNGTQIKVDCNTCLCQRGRWSCTQNVCHGTCTIYGNGHYISFDNKIYDFDGNCEFVAAQDYCDNGGSGGSFSILTENIPCGSTGVTCSKSVKVFLGNTMLKLSEKHVIKSVGEGGKQVNYVTREVGIYLVIEASNGILLIWDKKTTLFIKVSPAYKGKLCGLCGNFDDNSQNDFKTRHKIQVVDVLEFGNSWKVDATCPDATEVADPCTQNPHRHSWAEKQCGLIKSQVFKICHSKVDPKPFYEACVNDACSCDSGGDCECFCTAVAAYAQECTKAEACVYWRTPDICPMFCDFYNPNGHCEWHYHPCGNHSIQTCRSINHIYTSVTITYLEGCYPTCPKNKPIFDETSKKCVTKEECGCYINDVHYKSGAEILHYKKCHKCVCSSNGHIDCEKLEVSSCSSTTPITTTSITIPTIKPTAVTKAQSCTQVCSWSKWYSVSYPTYENGGDYETYRNIRNSGYDVCENPDQISCRAKHWPHKELHELQQTVKCDVSDGLICDNKDQKNEPICFDYEIRVYCCRASDKCSHTTTSSSAGTNGTTSFASTTTTKLRKTSSQTYGSTPIKKHFTSTHVTFSPTTTFNIKIGTPLPTSKTTLNPEHVRITTSRTKTTTVTSPASVSKAKTISTGSESTPATTTEAWVATIKPTPTSTSITILTTNKPTTISEGLTSSTISIAKITKYESPETSPASTTTPITSVPKIVFATNKTPFTEEPNKVISTPTMNITVSTTTSLTSLITSEGTETTTKYMPIKTEVMSTRSTNTFPYTTSKVISEYSTTTSTPDMTTQTLNTTSKPMKTTPPSSSKSTSMLMTEVTSTDYSEATISGTIGHMSSTKSTVPFLTETTESHITTVPKTSTGHTHATSIKETSISSSTMCICVYNGDSYFPGEIISKVTNETWCYEVICTLECRIEGRNLTCPTSTQASSLKTTPKVSTTPEKRGCSFEHFREPNETWMLDNCTMAKCLENHMVEITELQCEPPPMITCANGDQPKAVLDEDKCCWHWECDCTCSGWGDPHYRTFDGTYYTYQGTCTYTLVEEIVKKNNFAIYIDNYDCDTNDSVSCPRDLIIQYNTQEIQLVVDGSEEIEIQVFVNEEIVGTPYENYGVKIYTLGINYVVEIPELGVNITYNGLTFYIKLPYSRFGHNTQGQCGTCTNNRKDDCRTRDGIIVSNCEIMADSWIIEDPHKPECGQIESTLPPGVPPSLPTCQPSSLCSLIMGPTFQKCHLVVPPNDYYEACVYDACHISRSKIECSSLQHYAQLCADKGFCIDWRSQVPECSISCPSHKVYNACGLAKPRTCETNLEQWKTRDDEHLVEGCFCPRGTIRFSPAVDVCVPQCGCVGPDNIPRKFGEKFRFGCQNCTCIKGGSGITCQKHQCKVEAKVHCDLEGYFPEVQINPADPCCNMTVCKCDPSRCKTVTPTCELGYEAVGGFSEGHCCYVYQCVPKNVCVHGKAEYLPGAPIYTDKCQSCMCEQNGNQSIGMQITCKLFPSMQCPQGFVQKKGTDDCCGECEQTHCVLTLNGSSASYHLIKPGEIFPTENNCTVYSCNVVRNQFITSVSQISCPHFNEDDCEPGTTEFLPNGCCKVCVKKMKTCKLHEYYDYLSYNNCRTTDLVKMSRCDGSCATFSMYSMTTKAMSHECACCQEVQTSQKHVTLQCSDGSQVEHEYIAVEKCDCMNSGCDVVKSAEEMRSNTTTNVGRLSQD